MEDKKRRRLRQKFETLYAEVNEAHININMSGTRYVIIIPYLKRYRKLFDELILLYPDENLVDELTTIPDTMMDDVKHGPTTINILKFNINAILKDIFEFDGIWNLYQNERANHDYLMEKHSALEDDYKTLRNKFLEAQEKLNKYRTPLGHEINDE